MLLCPHVPARKAGATPSSALLLLLLSALVNTACGDEKKSSPSDCEAGKLGCACQAQSHCDDGLVCADGLCFAEGSAGLRVLDERARGCELLLEDQGAQVARASFEGSVQGRFVREAPRTAVAFIAAEDAPIPDGAVRIVFADDGAGAPRIATVTCTDTEGAPLKDAKVEIHE